MIEYGVLGPVTVSRGGVTVPVPTRMVRRLLALLLAHAGAPVPADALIEHLWAGQPPASARRTLSVYVSRLRGLNQLEVNVESAAGGYVLRPLPDELDAAVFSRLVAQSQQACAQGAVEAAIAAVRDALGLWRGPAYEGFRDLGPVAAEAARLDQLRLSAFEYSLDLLLDIGRPAEAMAGLREMISEHPYRERLRTRHMLALYRAGQRTEALDAYRELYDVLTGELGVLPGSEAAELHRAILAGDQGLAAAPNLIAGGGRVPELRGSALAPAQLPGDLYGFVGRREDVRALVETLGRARRGTAGLVITVISGMPGVGKTALATHVAHRVAGEFPDGQLYASLRGHDPGPPRSAADVLQGFLVALGESAPDLPADVDELAALYRSRLSGRRMLVYLDDARDAAQVRPLLPGTSGCAVIVTGRAGMAGLVVSDGAVLRPLDVLDDDSARELLTWRLGAGDTAPEAGEIVTLCGRLPLALAITAGRAADLPLATVAAELRQSDARLSALDLDGGTASVRAVFTWSYDKLSADGAQLFRSLGWLPSGELDSWTAASVSALALADVTRLLAELTDARLAADAGDGQLVVHDLLHAYAGELVGEQEGDEAASAARERLDDHLLHTAHQAARLMQPHRAMVALDEIAPGALPAALADRADAIDWLRRNRRRLLVTLREADRAGRFSYVWRLAWCLTEYLHRHGFGHDFLEVQQLALAAAEHVGDRFQIATALRNLARASMQLNRYAEARSLLERALEIAVTDQFASSRAVTLMALTELADMTSDPAAGLRSALAALDAYDEAGDMVGRVYAVNTLSYLYAQTGEYELALRYSGEAIEEFRRRGDDVGLSHAYEVRGRAFAAGGDYRASIDWYGRARVSMRRLGHVRAEADVLDNLGDVHRLAGDGQAAVAAWQQSLAMLESLGDHRAAAMRRKIADAARQQGRVPEAGTDITATPRGRR